MVCVESCVVSVGVLWGSSGLFVTYPTSTQAILLPFTLSYRFCLCRVCPRDPLPMHLANITSDLRGIITSLKRPTLVPLAS